MARPLRLGGERCSAPSPLGRVRTSGQPGGYASRPAVRPAGRQARRPERGLGLGGGRQRTRLHLSRTWEHTIPMRTHRCRDTLLHTPRPAPRPTTNTNAIAETERSPGSGDTCLSYPRGKILHTRNRHFRNHRGFSVVFCNGFSLFSGSFQRIVTFPMDVHWIFPMDFQWNFPMEFHFGDFWRVIFCHGTPSQPSSTEDRAASAATGPQCVTVATSRGRGRRRDLYSVHANVGWSQR